MPSRRGVPTLLMLHGESPGKVYDLNGETVVIGRHPASDIVLPRKFVSRRHARIVRAGGGFVLEDLESHCGTQIEGRAVDRPTPLHDGNTIRIGNYTLVFNAPSFTVKEDSDTGSTILGVLDLSGSGVGDDRGLAVKPEEKLKYVLEISRSLGETLHLDEVLEKTLEVLFQIFPQADRGFVLLKEDEAAVETRPRAIRFRSGPPRPLSISVAILDRVMNEGKAILSSEGSGVILPEALKVAGPTDRMTMCVPLLDPKRAPVGVLQLDTRAGQGKFREEDLDLLAAVANQVGVAVENARLHAALIHQTQIEQESQDAREVQLALLPARRPELPGYEFWEFYEPAHFVGGDYFDYIPYPPADPFRNGVASTRWAVALGDVEGKGMPAALLMARLSPEVRMFTLTLLDPARIVERLNRDLCEAGIGDRFITFLLVLVDGEAHTITVVRAGHMGPLLRHADGRVEVIGEPGGGKPLAIAADEAYPMTTTALEPGDLVVLYTDGLSDALDADGESIGLDRLKQVLSEARGTCAEVGEAIIAAVDQHVGLARRIDDITLICFGRR